MILRDPLPKEGGVGTVSAPIQLPEVKAPTITPGKVPDHIKDIEFKTDDAIEDIKIEQLPEQKGKEEKKEVTPAPEKKVEPEVKEEEKKVEEGEKNPLLKILKAPGAKKEAEEKKLDAEGKEIIKPIVPPSSRDYTGFSAEESAAAKQMSNEAFSLYSKVIKENKELSKLKETTYLQHEQAYTLDPQYQKIQTDAFYAQKEAAYWQQQLVDMDAGKDFVPITGWNQDGSPITGTPRKPTKADEIKVQQAFNNCNQAINQLSGALQQYPIRYKQTVATDLQNINNYRRQQFGWVSDPSLLEHSINIKGLGDRTLSQIREDVKSMLPVYMRNHPLAEVLGDVVIGLRIKDYQLNEATAASSVAKTKEEEQKLIEPSSKEKPTHKNGELIHGISEFKLDADLGV